MFAHKNSHLRCPFTQFHMINMLFCAILDDSFICKQVKLHERSRVQLPSLFAHAIILELHSKACDYLYKSHPNPCLFYLFICGVGDIMLNLNLPKHVSFTPGVYPSLHKHDSLCTLPFPHLKGMVFLSQISLARSVIQLPVKSIAS